MPLLAPYRELLDSPTLFKPQTATLATDPIGVGAVGGSGTRLLYQILSLAGVAMGAPVNTVGDSLEWPPYEILHNDELLRRHGRAALVSTALRQFEQLLVERRAELGLEGRIGWKVPGTFHWIAELAEYFPAFQYVHILRNGLDMAYSGNQNQAMNWASLLGIRLERTEEGRLTPASMLEYWLTANERALAAAEIHLPGRMYVVRFETLCEQPETEIERLLDFLHLPYTNGLLTSLVAQVRPPSSTGRYRRKPWRKDFSNRAMERLAALGYVP